MMVLCTPRAEALQEWHQTISPTTFNFLFQENGTANLHLDASVVGSGINVEYELELESSRSEIVKALDAFNRVKFADINLSLAANGSTAWIEDDAASELWGDPASWGVASATLRIIVQSCPSDCDGLPSGDGSGFVPGQKLGASAAIWVYDPSASAWVFPNNLSNPATLPHYAVLVLSRSNFLTPGSAVINDSALPSAEIIAHEIGHALGFEEQRIRKDALYSVLQSPTAVPNVWRVNSPAFRGGFFRLGAYAQALLSSEFPYSGFTLVSDEWVVHDEVLRRDPTQPLEHPERVVALSIFQVPEIAPLYLQWNSSSGQYLECQTHEIPRFYAQVSEVGSNTANCPSIELQHVISGNSDVVVASEAINHPCDIDFNEYQYKTYVWIDDADVAAAGYVNPPTATGTSQSIDFAIRISKVGFAPELNRDDNEVRLEGYEALVIFPEDTTDPRCVTKKGDAPNGPIARARLGEVIATNKQTPKSDQYTAIGMPHLDDGIVTDVGAVVFTAFEGINPPVGSEVGDIVAGFPLQVASPSATGSAEFGSALAINNNGTRIVVGAPGLDNDDGGVYICDRSGLTISCVNPIRPVAGLAGRFGAAVALSPDKKMLAIGEPDVGGGRVHLYLWNDSSSQYDPYLGLISAGVHYGAALAVTNEWLVIGDPDRTGGGYAEARYLDWDSYNNDGGQLLSLLLDLASMAPILSGDRFGHAVSVHGQVLVVGAPGTNDNDGAAYVFGQPHGDMTVANPVVDYSYKPDWRLVQSLPLVAATGSRFGKSVDNYRSNVIIGAPRYDSSNPVTPMDVGAAFIYRSRLNEGWETYDIIRGIDASDHMGAAVALGGMFWLGGEPFSNRNSVGVQVGKNVGRYRRGKYRTLAWYW